MVKEINDHRIAFGADFEVPLPADVRQDILDLADEVPQDLYDVARDHLRKLLAPELAKFEQGIKYLILL